MTALAELAWPRLRPSGALLAVPLGATEQHGPHLPYTTDTEIAAALVARLAARRPGVVAAPAVPYGSSGEHQAFPGTLSIGAEATETLLVELGRSATETFARVLLVSAHGGNEAPLERAVARLRAEGRDVRAWRTAWGGDAHAGRTETSVMLALAPDRVALDRAAAGNPEALPALMPALRAGGVRPVSPTGVLGDPAGASAAEGERLLDEAVAALDRLVRGWAPA